MDMFESTKGKESPKFRNSTIEQFLHTVAYMKLRNLSFTTAAKRLGFSSASMSSIRIALRNGTFVTQAQLSEADLARIKEAEKWLASKYEEVPEAASDDENVLCIYGPAQKVLEGLKNFIEKKQQGKQL